MGRSNRSGSSNGAVATCAKPTESPDTRDVVRPALDVAPAMAFTSSRPSPLRPSVLPLHPLPPRPVVSVAICTYNYGRFLDECLDSCRAQTWPPDQVVVVDDGSCDDTGAVLADYAARYPTSKLEVLRQLNRGMSAATNAALAACTGDVVLLLDADDLMLPTRVEQVVGALRRPVDGGLPGWVHHRIARFSRRHQDLGTMPHYAGKAPQGVLIDRLLDSAESPVQTPTSGLAFRRELLVAIGPLDEHRSLPQDMQLWLAASLLCPAAWIPEALSRYRIHGQSDSAGGMLSTLPKVRLMIERHERLASWLHRVLKRHHPHLADRLHSVTEQRSYQWLKFLEKWWSGAGKDIPVLWRLLRHPENRGAPLQERLYLYSSLVLPKRAFQALSRLLFGASPMKARLRRMLGRY
ncbi:MAG: glycosyltransferase [Alcaligenaceae bacterium]|nr:MAG: glycosyltransferase [Alcaligenaceae bacterium]